MQAMAIRRLVNAVLKRLQRRPRREEATAGWERW
jgi:hypothetical protein